MVVRMRHTRAHTRNRRSHHALKGASLTTAENGAPRPRHRALLDGSKYRGRSVLDLVAKRFARKQKAHKAQAPAEEAPKKTEEKVEEPKAEKKEEKA